jgi:hypothetical protein
MYFEELRCKGIVWIQMAQDRIQCRAVVDMRMNIMWRIS